MGDEPRFIRPGEERAIQEAVGELVGLLAGRGVTLATAESCTGGWLGKLVTGVPGASGVYVGGWVTYCNEMKAGQLDVPEELIGRCGAVSEQVAMGMARGAVEKSGAEIGVSITGIAGPDGGTVEKPVGTVWVGMARAGARVTGSNRANRAVVSGACLCSLDGDRGRIRLGAVWAAVQLVRYVLIGAPLEREVWLRGLEVI